jgi:hypothetical protein
MCACKDSPQKEKNYFLNLLAKIQKILKSKTNKKIDFQKTSIKNT